MVNQTETLNRLNKEKNYEDRLVADLTEYFIFSLESVTDIDKQQRKQIQSSLERIKYESMDHSDMFNNLIQLVMENGEDNY
jgi:hypothetical protein